MPRDYRVYLDDILEAAERILAYTADHSFEQFSHDSRTVDAVIRNFIVIGEATKKIPENVRSQYPQVQWRDMAGLRNVVVHQYFGVKLDVIWKVIQADLPALEKELRRILSEDG